MTRRSPRQISKPSGSSTSSEKEIEVVTEPQSLSPRRSARVSTSDFSTPRNTTICRSLASAKTRKGTKDDLNAGDIKRPIQELNDHTNSLDDDDDLYAEFESTSSPRGETIVEILHHYPLFLLEEMNAEVAVTQNRAKLLASKFAKRAPQLSSDFHSKPISLPLPYTGGLTAVERLIQLEESCHWGTQKSGHLYFYRRALDECFFLTLLHVEPLFDLHQLASIFQNQDRNKGWGFYSRSLMDNVELMVNKMID